MSESQLRRSRVNECPWLQPAAEAFEDAHQLWHDAFEQYHDPAGFRRQIDALIQTARNVTFRLQASKGDAPVAFDWYESDEAGSWRSFLRSSSEMKWLHDARTEVTKRRGLSRDSYALVRLVEGYYEPRKQLLKVPATIPTSKVVDAAIKQVPVEYRQHVAIEVRRRWESPDFPGRELLEVVRHCLHILDALLLFAAEVSAGEEPGDPAAFVETVAQPICMVITPDLLPLTFEADTKDQVSIGFEPHRVTADDVNEARAKYGMSRVARKHAPRGEGAHAIARRFHEGSRAAFKKDGAVLPLAFLLDPEGEVHQFETLAEDKREKYLIWRRIGEHALGRTFNLAIHTGEMWIAAVPDDVQPYLEVSEQPGVRELIATVWETHDGDKGIISSRIFRLGPARFLSKPTEQSDIDEEFTFFDPIRRAWAKREKAVGNDEAD